MTQKSGCLSEMVLLKQLQHLKLVVAKYEDDEYVFVTYDLKDL